MPPRKSSPEGVNPGPRPNNRDTLHGIGLSDFFDVDKQLTNHSSKAAMGLWEALNIIKIATKNSDIVGADVNELAPIKGFSSYNFLVAKLVYKILSLKFLSKN